MTDQGVAEFVWQRRRNRFKEKVESKEGLPLAMWITIPFYGVVEMACALGIDAVFIDLEHASISLNEAVELIMAAQVHGVSAIVRPADPSPHEIARILDAGADGIMFSSVPNGEAARSARLSMVHQPEGLRGFSGAHNRHAAWQDRESVRSPKYIQKAAADLVRIIAIETPEGFENLEAILDEGKPDLVTFGWGDFTAAMNWDTKKSEASYRRVYDLCKSRGIGICIAPRDLDNYYPGCYANIGVDSTFLTTETTKALKDMRANFAASQESPGSRSIK